MLYQSSKWGASFNMLYIQHCYLGLNVDPSSRQKRCSYSKIMSEGVAIRKPVRITLTIGLNDEFPEHCTTVETQEENAVDSNCPC